MEVEIANATFGTEVRADRVVRTGTAVARVTIDGETREFPATWHNEHNGISRWYVESGFAAVYRSGTKIHNVGAMIHAGPTGTSLHCTAGRARMFSRMPLCIGFFNGGANAASRTFRR
jgi:hypothetical protein